jgi:hypothetical protein
MNRFFGQRLFIGLAMAMAIVGLSGCSASSEKKEDQPTIYTVGVYYNAGLKRIPCYWTGTTRTNLAGDGTHEALAGSIFVSGGTVYTAGSYDDGSKFIPCYWTGTTRRDLADDGAQYAYAYSIFVSGGTVYTAGHYDDGSKWIPCYWTGTTKTNLPGDGTHDALDLGFLARASGIFVE